MPAIKYHDGTTWQYASTVGGSMATVSATEPANPATDELWFDLNVGYLKAWSGSAWVGSGGSSGPSPLLLMGA